MSKCNAYISIPRHNGEMLAKPTVEQMNAMFYYVGNSRWFELFGTPERASNILALGCMGASEDVCDSCVFRECDGKLRRCGSIHSIATQMLEWLESEVRDD